jgi:tetratricopeptide (TPR) repeat protein
MNQQAPTQLISEIWNQATKDDATAIERAKHAASNYPRCADAHLLLARVSRRFLGEAIAYDLFSNAIAVSEQPSAVLHFERGWTSFSLGNIDAAINDFTNGIDIERANSSNFLTETLYFFRADARIAIGDLQGAEDDLLGVREDFGMWTNRLVTKRELLDKLSD